MALAIAKSPLLLNIMTLSASAEVRVKRGQIVETHTGIGGLARHQAAEQHRVRLGHIRTQVTNTSASSKSV